MRVVVDTTTLISSFISKQGFPHQVVDLWFRKQYTLVTSVWQMEEFKGVTRRERVRPLLNANEVGRFVNLLRDRAIVLEVLSEGVYSPDPDDNPILAAAIDSESMLCQVISNTCSRLRASWVYPFCLPENLPSYLVV